MSLAIIASETVKQPGLADKAEKIAFFQSLTHDVIVLMGLSFIVGSLVTVFLLLLLDMMRSLRRPEHEEGEDQTDA